MTEHPGERPRVEPPDRGFNPLERSPGAQREIDAADRAVRVSAAVWGIMIGLVGVPISLLLAYKVEAEPPVLFLFWLGGPVAGIFVYWMVVNLSGGGGQVMGKIHNPSGKSTPAVREYSKGQALAIQGHYREAIEVYEDAVTIYPHDPEPYVRIARLLRDRLGEFEEAVGWFKRARSESQIDAGREMLVTQEIIEIYRRRLLEPKRAIPELARLIDRFPAHPSAEAARRELAELRALSADDGR